MFLTKQAIRKQLFYELLQFASLGLSPGKPAQLLPGTLLGSGASFDIATGLEFSKKQLEQLSHLGATNEQNKEFTQLIDALFAYKSATAGSDNVFNAYKQVDQIPSANPCAWLMLAPLLLEPGKEKEFATPEDFLSYLKLPHVAFKFEKKAPIQHTGLAVAVQSANPEMVTAFLCSDFFKDELTKEDLMTKEDLKKLLSMTKKDKDKYDVKTRLLLLEHANQLGRLLPWITTDDELKKNVLIDYTELRALWHLWSEKQRAEFIEQSSSQLWLNITHDHQLSRKKIKLLLGADFSKLCHKLKNDQSVENVENISSVVHYLEPEEQFDFLLNSTNVDTLFLSQPPEHLDNLLTKLGYKKNKNGDIKTTRYLLAPPFASIHDDLINALIKLRLKPKTLLEALKQVDAYVHSSSAKTAYNQILNDIATKTVEAEYASMSKIKRWFYRLLRKWNLMRKSPLHPYMDDLKKVIDTHPVILKGEWLLTIFPDSVKGYERAFAELRKGNIAGFWQAVPEDIQSKVVKDPLRFEGLLHQFRQPTDQRKQFISTLDIPSLKYFNTPVGMRQLLLNTPSFEIGQHMPVLVEAMKKNEIDVLNDASNIAILLVENDVVFQGVKPLFSYHGDVLLQAKIVTALEANDTPLSQEKRFLRFIEAGDLHAKQFNELLREIKKAEPACASRCWAIAQSSLFSQWFVSVEWLNRFEPLDLENRIDFFEKLNPDGGINAEDFYELLINKDVDKMPLLWNLIPEAQWQKWLSDKSLPTKTAHLLSLMPFPIRLEFFQSMLEMRPDETQTISHMIETLSDQDIKTAIEKTKGVEGLRQELNETMDKRRRKLTDDLLKFSQSVEALNTDLNAILPDELKQQKTDKVPNFWKDLTKNEQYKKYVDSMTKLAKDVQLISDSHTHIANNPLLAKMRHDEQVITSLSNVNNALVKLSAQVIRFAQIQNADVPHEMGENLKKIADLWTIIEDVFVTSLPLNNQSSSSTANTQGTSMVDLLRQSKTMMVELTQLLETFPATYTTRLFFNKRTIGKSMQETLRKQFEQLSSNMQSLKATIDRAEGVMPDNIDLVLNECTSARAQLEKASVAYNTVLKVPHKGPTLGNQLGALLVEAQEVIQRLKPAPQASPLP